MIASENFSADVIRAQIEAILRAWGMSEEKLRLTAEVMVETDLRGIDSHGISMLTQYAQMQKAGQLALQAEPCIVRQSASTALIDGGAGLGHPAAFTGMNLAIEKALAHDVGVVSVFNSHHFGAAGYYATMAAERGLIGVVSSTTRVISVVPTNGVERVLGTNPIAVAVPGGRRPSICVDISTSVVAANKVKVYALQDKELPAGWVIDGDGQPVTDSGQAFRQIFESQVGGLTPIGGDGSEMGGHKGYGLGLIAQILSGTLSGGSFSPVRNRTQKPSDPDNIGHFFMALNPVAFRPFDVFQSDVETVIDTLHAVKPIREDEPVLVPGEPEWAAREERLVKGIPIPETLKLKVREIAEAAGAPYLLQSAMAA
ncbi:Ldh family oxidoreductase [Microvirga terrae]|uniref:Ldh family oxidoreductase n=1 Tax=Microvirga terrae TaxID=2740529 RepID=A0ABY5RU91_9HYPH|nr:Ldh family oxidoreductase [Microvirga terrae]UVF19524.1 Ldh family oxidoreductase [Microvirga terrae]